MKIKLFSTRFFIAGIFFSTFLVFAEKADACTCYCQKPEGGYVEMTKSSEYNPNSGEDCDTFCKNNGYTFYADGFALWNSEVTNATGVNCPSSTTSAPATNAAAVERVALCCLSRDKTKCESLSGTGSGICKDGYDRKLCTDYKSVCPQPTSVASGSWGTPETQGGSGQTNSCCLTETELCYTIDSGKCTDRSEPIYCDSNSKCPQPRPSSGSSVNNIAPAIGGTTIMNPIAYDSVEGFLLHFLSVLQKIIVLLSMVFIVIGAILYIVSAGGGMVETAKKTITAALIGLALGLAAPSFLKEISIILGWNQDLGPAASALTISQIATNVLSFLLGAVGILSIIMLVIGGSMYLTSAGNENQIDKGKDIVKASIIGIIIAFSAMILVRQIAKFFM